MSGSRGERKITRGGVEALMSKEEDLKMEEVVGAMMDTSRTGVGATIVMGKEGSMEASITGKTIGIGMKQDIEVATLGQATVEAINQQAAITSQDNIGVKVKGGTVGTKKVLTRDEVMHQVADGKERDQGTITGPTKAADGNIKGTDIAAGHGLNRKSRVVGVGVEEVSWIRGGAKVVLQTGMAAINRAGAEGQERLEAEEVRPDGTIMMVSSSRKLSWIDKLILRDLL